MCSVSLSKKMAMIIFLPTRMITLFTVVALIPMLNVSWEITTAIFQAFFPIYIASFFIEVILTKEGLKKSFSNLSTKYLIGLPVEFAGVASFALLSFSSQPDEAKLLGMIVSAVVIACAFFVEAYYHYVIPRLAKIILTSQQQVLVLIPFTVFIVIFGTYLLNQNPLL